MTRRHEYTSDELVWCMDFDKDATVRWYIGGHPLRFATPGAAPHCGHCHDRLDGRST